MHPHIKSLSSIKVFPFEGQDLNIQNSFLELIVLYDIFDSKDNKLKACFFIDSELKEVNHIYDSFKRIKKVDCNNYKEACAKLNTIKQASIQEIEYISFCKMEGEDFKQITNELLNYKIYFLKYYARWESISNQELENISKINPQKLYQLILNI